MTDQKNKELSLKPNQEEQLQNFLIKQLQDKEITLSAFIEGFKSLQDTDKNHLLEFFNSTIQKQKNCQSLIKEIQAIEEPYSCDYFKLKSKDNTKGLEIARAGLTIFMANSNHGKTLFSINIFCQFLIKNQDKKACYISIEEEQRDILLKVLTAYYNQNTTTTYRKTMWDFKRNPTQETISELTKRAYITSQSEFEKKFEGKPFNDKVIIEYCKLLIEEGYKMIFIDYVQDIEMEGQRNKNFNYELKDLVRSLNTLAISNSISIVLNAQTSSSTKTPFYDLSCIGDSYDIVRKAKNVYSIWDCSKPAMNNNGVYHSPKLYSYPKIEKEQQQPRRDFLLVECLKSRNGLGYYKNAFKYYGSQFFVSNEEEDKGEPELICYNNTK